MHPAWVRGVAPLKLFKWLTKILGNPFPFVSRYMDISCLFWAALELNQGGEVVGCTLWWAVSCSHPTELRSGMSVTAIIGTWVEAKACFLFTDNYWLCVFKKHSHLCCVLQLGFVIAAHGQRNQTNFSEHGCCSDLPSPLQSSWSVQNGFWWMEKATLNEGRKGQTDQKVKAILLPA